jgi:hypothetical protein
MSDAGTPSNQATSCTCGHVRDAHEHYRRGTDCALCECPKFRAARRGADADPTPAPTPDADATTAADLVIDLRPEPAVAAATAAPAERELVVR